MQSAAYFNLPEALPEAAIPERKNSVHPYNGPQKSTIETNWTTFQEQEMNRQAVYGVFAGQIPVIRQKEFLSLEECNQLLEVLRSHTIGDYDVNHVWPRVGFVGVSQTDYAKDKKTYFSKAEEAYSLQNRWKDELGIDIMERVAQSLEEASGLPVRLAREGDQDYFAGVIRAIDTGIQIHADFARFEGHGWEIGKIAAQMSWNILLNPVPGGDTFIYDRQWQAPQDDYAWRKVFPKYAYDPRLVDGHAVKVVKPVPGDLYWFNPRNFHEVRPCDISKDSNQQAATRYTISSMVGLLEGVDGQPDTIIMWS
ncbi:hypothetical protein HIM_08924 [Hirsutella minnesotensis 3608]|uniref:Prolyl 4-hydroxylase alpha subunit Fe(2+) 2OG dioxygenase domain-containing protein n=1 Tax=Hirsutella minnesotensis 3608 TaxID=1043627 RepID=A0A0F7ZGY2_9HYPO|nr:hypothetical protein HIM_08924 [Hirsutella minnesotensis 3608]